MWGWGLRGSCVGDNSTLDPITNPPFMEKGCSKPTSRHCVQSLAEPSRLVFPQSQALPSLGVLCSMNQAVRTLFLLG